MYAVAKGALHAKWFNKVTGWYDDGGQTAQILALTLDRRAPLMMSPAQRAGVLGRLVANIHAHGNHSTSGIIGFRYAMDVLSDNGYGALALALMTQTSYPSFGYQILNKCVPRAVQFQGDEAQFDSVCPSVRAPHAWGARADGLAKSRRIPHPNHFASLFRAGTSRRRRSGSCGSRT